MAATEKAWVEIPVEILEDVLYKTTELCVKKAHDIEDLNKKVEELVDQVAKLTAENRELKNQNTDLPIKLQEAYKDDQF